MIGTEVIADDRELIAERLRHWCDERGCALVLTTGGTGFSPDDLTPEATRDVIEREAPGLPEAMRAASREHTPMWMTSRAVAGTRGRSADRQLPRQSRRRSNRPERPWSARSHMRSRCSRAAALRRSEAKPTRRL